MKKEKNIIIFLGSAENSDIDEVREFEKSQKRFFRIVLLTSKNKRLNKKPLKWEEIKEKFDLTLICDTKNINSIKKIIAPIKDDISIVACYYDARMPLYAKLVKLLPSVNMPSKKSLEICNSKLEMRKMFIKKYSEITPRFILLNGVEDSKIVSKKIGFPCITKPLNLSKSRLVIKSSNPLELKKNLKKTFAKIKETYNYVQSESVPQVLAEEYMEGDLYSIDAYVSPKGKIYLTPIVRVVTGKDIGIDDFFNYYRVTPAKIIKKEERKAQESSIKAIKATGPTSVTIHIELIRTAEENWKVVELQTRPGGYRNEMLKLSFGIKHYENDFLNRMGKKPIIPRKPKSYTAVLEIFPEKEGKIVAIKGKEKMKKLKSFLRYEQAKKIGDMSGYSRDGYTYVLQVVLNHKKEILLYNDLKKIRKIVKIKVL